MDDEIKIKVKDEKSGYERFKKITMENMERVVVRSLSGKLKTLQMIFSENFMNWQKMSNRMRWQIFLSH